MSKGETIVGLDIGTTKICAIIGEMDEDRMEIIGVGTAPSHGLKKGVVVNIDSTIKSVENAISEAELMAGVEVSSVYAGIAGSHIKGINSHGVIAISRGREVTSADMERVIDAAKAVSIPLDRQIIHVLPQQFIIDGQDGIKEPIGMSGTRLEVEIHIVTGAVTSAQNIVKCVNRSGFEVDDLVLEPLAASYSVLTEDEKDLGVVLVDIGGGTTDIGIFIDGSIWHTSVLSIGGDNVTKDISVGLRTPVVDAEKIKINYGCATPSLVKDDEMIEIPSVGERRSRTLPRQVLSEIIEPRMEEIFTLINQEIRMTGYENMIASGIVLTGGAAMLKGSAELAEKIFDLPVRIGVPKGVAGLVDVISSPVYATGVGLVLYGMKNRLDGKKTRSVGGNVFKKVSGKMKDWFSDFF
ncbi:cell division protein FtsA [Candidatus Desantisbacteria bacterium]|nr:cell division protein FtsA [Candidatus Desantisbacteria bacterium]